MRVLLTGHLGYIGSVMTPMLLQAGHEVVGLDSDLYERCTFAQAASSATCRPSARTRATSSSPTSSASTRSSISPLSPTIRSAISSRAHRRHQSPRQRADRRARQEGRRRRFVFASSCSNYGQAGEGMIDETGALNPVTAYGESKVMSEREHLSLGGRRLLSRLFAARNGLWRCRRGCASISS